MRSKLLDQIYKTLQKTKIKKTLSRQDLFLIVKYCKSRTKIYLLKSDWLSFSFNIIFQRRPFKTQARNCLNSNFFHWVCWVQRNFSKKDFWPTSTNHPLRKIKIFKVWLWQQRPALKSVQAAALVPYTVLATPPNSVLTTALGPKESQPNLE